LETLESKCILNHLILNNRYQAHLEPLNGIDFCAIMNGIFLFSSSFFTFTLYTHSIHLKDTPLRFLVLIRTTAYNIDAKYYNTNSAFQDVHFLQYAPLVLRLGPLNFSSFFGINLSYLFLQWHSQLLNEVTGAAENFNN